MTVRVEITPAMLGRADAYQQAIEVRGIKAAGNYTGLAVANRWRNGYLGEFAFEAYLQTTGRRFDYLPAPDGHPDTGDFRVYQRGRPLRVDVKTAAERTHRYFLIPEAQLERPSSAIYVAARLDIDELAVELFGFFTKRDVEVMGTDNQLQVPARRSPLSWAKDLDKLIGRIDGNRD